MHMSTKKGKMLSCIKPCYSGHNIVDNRLVDSATLELGMWAGTWFHLTKTVVITLKSSVVYWVTARFQDWYQSPSVASSVHWKHFHQPTVVSAAYSHGMLSKWSLRNDNCDSVSVAIMGNSCNWKSVTILAIMGLNHKNCCAKLIKPSVLTCFSKHSGTGCRWC